MRSIPAAFIVVLLVFPLFLGALCTVALSTWVTDRSLYASILGDSRLYEIPTRTGAQHWGYGHWREDARFYARAHGRWAQELAEVPPEALVPALREVVSPEYSRSQALRLLNEGFDFADGKSGVLDPVIDLVPLNNALAGEAAGRFSRALAEALPAGPAGQPLISRAGGLPRMRPSDMSVSRAAELIQASLPAFVRTVPDRFRIAEEPGPLLRTGEWGFARGFSVLRSMVIVDIAFLAVAAGFWILAGFVGGGDVRTRLLWLGWSLFAPAFVVFVMGLSMRLGFPLQAITYGIREARLEDLGFSAGFAQAVIAAARTMILRISTGFLATGGVAGGISLGLLAWAWGTPKQERAAA